MGKNVVQDLSSQINRFVSDHGSEILTGLGVFGMAGAIVSAIKATIKAKDKIDRTQEDIPEVLEPKAIIKLVWKDYIPTGLMFIGGTSCFLGASVLNSKKQAALAALYSLSENTLRTYRNKVVETIGAEKEDDIRSEINKRKAANSNAQVIHAMSPNVQGTVKCFDTYSGRYFMNSRNEINKVINEFNRTLISSGDSVSLNEFYEEIGLDGIAAGWDVGWNVYRGLIEVKFDAILPEDGIPCLCFEFVQRPEVGYNKG